jgi:hypothetical protein
MSMHGHQVSGGHIAVISQVGSHVVIADFWKLQSWAQG